MYFNVRDILPKSGTFPSGQPVYTYIHFLPKREHSPCIFYRPIAIWCIWKWLLLFVILNTQIQVFRAVTPCILVNYPQQRYLEEGGTVNLRKYVTIYQSRQLQLSRTESAAAPLWEPNISHTKQINTLYAQNAELFNAKASGTYSYHWDLNG